MKANTKGGFTVETPPFNFWQASTDNSLTQLLTWISIVHI
jgi:hypothetical protein